jgi:capsular exopolysaccharide synthesis family protein
MDTEQTHLSLDLEQALGFLRRRAVWIVLCFVLVTAASYIYSKHQTKQYTATASLVFSETQLGQQLAGLSVASSNNARAQQNTNLKLVQLGDMAAKTAGLLDHGLTKEEVSAALSVSAQAESNIVNVSASATSPALAADIANTYTNQFVTEQQRSKHVYYASALRLVNKQLAALPPRQVAEPAGLALQGRAQSLRLLAKLQSGDVQLAQAATVPTSPSSPQVARNTILGAVLALLLGLGIAFLLERLDRRIKEPKDLEAIYGLPVLGVIPESDALSRAGRPDGGARDVLPPGETEIFRMIRAHLRYFSVDRDLRTLLVISAARGEGKTTVSRHLAEAGAAMGGRTLLMEADLRAPTLATQLGIAPGPGLADVMSHSDLTLNEAIQSLDVGQPSSREGREHRMDVLLSGFMQPPNPAELIESGAMQAVLEQAKSAYELVVIDTPPLTAVSDAFPLLSKVDGIIVVGRIGRNRRDAEDLHETLRPVEAPLLGVVANGLKSRGRTPYAYGYEGNERASASVDTLDAPAPEPSAGPTQS